MNVRTLAFLGIATLFTADVHAGTRTVAYGGQTAPGVTGGTFAQLYFTGGDPIGPVINDAGQVAFAATLSTGVGGVTAPDDTGIWMESGGALALVAREGHAAPGGPAGALFRRVTAPVISNEGKISFSGLMREGVAGVTTDTNSGIWSNGNTALTLIAREGDHAPGTPAGVAFATLLDPNLSAASQAVFRSTLAGTGVTASNDDGIWAQHNGALELVARAGDSYSSFPQGVTIASFPQTQPVINSSGDVAFRAALAGAGVTAQNDAVVLARRNGALQIVARERATLDFTSFSEPVLNSSGVVAFKATLAGPVATNQGVFTEIGGAITEVSRKGDAAPGIDPGVLFSSYSEPMLNDAGYVAFSATLAGTNINTANDSSLWAKRESGLSLIAREGMQAPGLAAGVAFGDFFETAFNAAGQVAFVATLTGPGIGANDRSLWVETLGGELVNVQREGAQIEVAPGVTRSVAEIFFSSAASTQDGRRSGFNDLGEVAYLASFSDGDSGIFVSDAGVSAAGDFNGNGVVEGADLLIWQRNFGNAGSALPSNGDANGDGNVNGADLAVWRDEFGSTASIADVAVIPEPSAGVLAALFLLAMAACNKPQR